MFVFQSEKNKSHIYIPFFTRCLTESMFSRIALWKCIRWFCDPHAFKREIIQHLGNSFHRSPWSFPAFFLIGESFFLKTLWMKEAIMVFPG
jgi:hypothetical protein